MFFGCVSYSLEHADCDWRPDACAAALVLASCARLRPDAARTRACSPSDIVGISAELKKKRGELFLSNSSPQIPN